MNHYTIAVPTNANNMFAGRVVFQGSEIECNNKADQLHLESLIDVEERQQLANKLAYPGVAATEFPVETFTVISQFDWEDEFKTRTQNC